jgi:hypothetical protein
MSKQELPDYEFSIDGQTGLAMLTIYAMPNLVRDTIAVFEELLWSGSYPRGTNLLVELKKQPAVWSAKALRQIVEYLNSKSDILGTKIAVLSPHEEHKTMMTVANAISIASDGDLMIIPFPVEDRVRAMTFLLADDMIAWGEKKLSDGGELRFSVGAEKCVSVVTMHSVPSPFSTKDLVGMSNAALMHPSFQPGSNVLFEMCDYVPVRSQFAQYEIVEYMMRVVIPRIGNKFAWLVRNNAQAQLANHLRGLLNLQGSGIETGVFMPFERTDAMDFLCPN